jgi:hypothetical protein
MAAARRSREPFFTKSQSFKLAGNKDGSDSPIVLGLPGAISDQLYGRGIEPR